MSWQGGLVFPGIGILQFAQLFGFLFCSGIFFALLMRIRYLLLEKLVAVFNPFVWLGMVILKWFWREAKQYKEARGLTRN